MFVTNDMLEMIVTETMNYSMMKHGVAIILNKYDIEQFISVHYNMALVKMPDVRCYWDTYSRCPPVADVMSSQQLTGDRSPKCAAITGVGVDMSPHCFIKCPNVSASYTASGSKV